MSKLSVQSPPNFGLVPPLLKSQRSRSLSPAPKKKRSISTNLLPKLLFPGMNASISRSTGQLDLSEAQSEVNGSLNCEQEPQYLTPPSKFANGPDGEGGEEDTNEEGRAVDYRSDKEHNPLNKTPSRVSLMSTSSKYSTSTSPPHAILQARELSKDDSSPPKADSDVNHSRSSSPKGSQKGADRKNLNTGVSGIQRAASAIKTFIAPNYKSRNEEFRRLFKPIPESEKFVIDYSCAYQREILVHGRMYVSQQSVCFYANIFGWDTNLIIAFKDIGIITKERTAKIIPNAIQFVTQTGDKYFFTSFGGRDKTHMLLFRLWQDALLDQVHSPQEIWSWAQQGYSENDVSDSEDNILMQDLSESPTIKLKNVPSWMGLQENNKENSLPDQSDTPIFIAGCTTDENENSEQNMTIRHRRKQRNESPPKVVHTPPSPNFDAGLILDDSSEADVKAKKEKCKKVGKSVSLEENIVNSELSCPCKDHPGLCLMNQVYPVSVDQLFNFLFTNSEFNKQFLEMRKTRDVVVTDWMEDPATKQKRRHMTYTVSLSHSMGPKSCIVQEKQCVSHYGNSGQVYVIKSDAENQGVPYADSFTVQSTFCLSRVSANQGRIQCHANVAFKKTVWGIVKSFIEKNTFAGMQEHFKELDTQLKMECDKLGLPVSPFVDENEIVDAARHRRMSVQERGGSLRRQQENLDDSLFKRDYASTFDLSVKALVVLLVVMLFMNAMLLYKLWSIDSTAHTPNIYGYSLQELKTILRSSDTPDEDVKRIIELHQQNVRSKWMEAIQSALHKLGQLESEISQLKQYISAAEQDYAHFFEEQKE